LDSAEKLKKEANAYQYTGNIDNNVLPPPLTPLIVFGYNEE